MKFRVAILALAALGVAGTMASASEDPIATRKAVMKSVGASMKVVVPMVKGEADYDAVKAELAMRVIQNGAIGVIHYFPAGSETGGETEAAPKIWEDMAGFKAKAASLEADAGAAITAAAGGLDAFREAFGKMAGNCKGCHEDYRIKKN